MTQHLTDPRLDPESYYLLPDDWAEVQGIRRALYEFNNTLAGRMLIGPAVSHHPLLVRRSSATLLAGNRKTIRAWAWFVPSCAITLWYVVHVCGMPFWQYYLLIAYPGISLALVRSYCEHQAAEHVEHRTIIVEASPFWSLLFLNNNLHVAHHTRARPGLVQDPGLLPRRARAADRPNNGYTMKGYGEIFARFFLKAKEPMPYPNMDWLKKP